jgi:hypothetical protein
VTFEIRSADGRILTVHTEVGNGVTRVVVETKQQQEPAQSLDQTGDEA